MDKEFNFDEFMEKAEKELSTANDFGDVLLDMAINSAVTEDERLAFMIARKASDIFKIAMDDIADPDIILQMDFETKKNVYAYLCAVADGLKEFSKQLKDGDVL